jgi:hypothetical protein
MYINFGVQNHFVNEVIGPRSGGGLDTMAEGRLWTLKTWILARTSAMETNLCG